MSTTEIHCDPECPAGTLCTESGCVPGDGSTIDLSAAQTDGAGECTPACGPAVPHCRRGTCVPCLADGDCPPGSVCREVGVSTACVPGCADDSRCAGAGRDDGGPGSMKCCGGQCLNVDHDADNCGACGAACMKPHAGAACAGGLCTAGACATGWADCNADPADGCETNLLVDTHNCAGCGKECSVAHGVAGCANGCYLAACTFGWDDCDAQPDNGCETNVVSDPRNCGACAMACNPLPHAQNGCVNAVCQVTRCDAGFANCNGDPKDGCEIATLNDASNCGECGTVCGQGLVCKNASCTCPQCDFPNAKSACANLKCVLTSCLPGFGDCNNNVQDGCETTIATDPVNCGACGNACNGMNPYCSEGKCTDNPCTGKVGGPIAAAMPTPMMAFCWYLSKGGATCDDVCAASGGVNQANDAVNALGDDCLGGTPGQPATWFFQNANACNWQMSLVSPTGYKTLGHGYNGDDNVGRVGLYAGKCSLLGNLLPNSGTFPNESNDSTATGNSRCVVCACSH